MEKIAASILIKAVHLVVKKRHHTTECSSETQFANQRIYDPWSQMTRKNITIIVHYDNVQW